MKSLPRRDFLKQATVAAVAGAGVVAAGCGRPAQEQGSQVDFSQTFKWKMATAWPPHFPVLGESAEQMAAWIKEMSGGRLEISVHGGGELIPPLECFDAVSQGSIQMGHGASYYWAGKAPATQFFTSVPFGMNAQQMNTWLRFGGGQELWEEVYAPFNLVPMVVGNSGVQMGGWFNREINSLADLKGLKMRIPGLGGKVMAKCGVAVTMAPAAELFTSLERGVLDALEWVGPYHDYLIGFHRIAKYYYWPGWQEPGSALEMFINRQAWETLPADLQAIVRAAAGHANMAMLVHFEQENAIHLRKLVDEAKVQLRRFPDEVIAALRQHTATVLDELCASDPASRKVYDSYRKFLAAQQEWSTISERATFQITG